MRTRGMSVLRVVTIFLAAFLLRTSSTLGQVPGPSTVSPPTVESVEKEIEELRARIQHLEASAGKDGLALIENLHKIAECLTTLIDLQEKLKALAKKDGESSSQLISDSIKRLNESVAECCAFHRPVILFFAITTPVSILVHPLIFWWVSLNVGRKLLKDKIDQESRKKAPPHQEASSASA